MKHILVRWGVGLSKYMFELLMYNVSMLQSQRETNCVRLISSQTTYWDIEQYLTNHCLSDYKYVSPNASINEIM